MPKVIQPRRYDKDLTVEEFWRIRDEGRQQPRATPFHAYREAEVEQRHRYQKPSEQAKSFNPLALTLRPRTQTDPNDLQVLGNEQDSCVGEYLISVQGRLSGGLLELKRWTMGRQSVLYNMERIYGLLWSQLHLEQAWPLLQAVTRDARGSSLSIWLASGIKAFADAASEFCGSAFNKIFFKNLFDSLCVLMETHYDTIVEDLPAFFRELAEQMMKHSNKYIRKFSVQAFSYILANLPEETYGEFMKHLLELQKEGFFCGKVSLAELLLQRLKIVRGCLTAASLAHFLVQLETLGSMMEGKEQFSTIASDYVGLVLDSLNCRQGSQEAQLLFDFIYVVKAIITFAQKEEHNYYLPVLVMGLSNFLAGYRNDRKKFLPHTAAQGHYLRQVWELLGDFFKHHVSYFSPREELNQALAVLSLKSGATFYFSTDIIAYMKSQEQATRILIQYVYQHDQRLENSMIEVVLLLAKEFIRRFIVQDQETIIVYTLVVLTGRFQLGKLIELDWLQLTVEDIQQKIERAKFEDDFIVVMRLLTIIRIPQESKIGLLKRAGSVYQGHMQSFEAYVANTMEEENEVELSGPQFYNCKHFTKQLIIYAHHEIRWLSHIFNVYEAFAILQQHLAAENTNTYLNSCLWDQLIISRPSALSILSSKGYFSSSSPNSPLIANLLSSRNREVRYQSLLIISSRFQQEFSNTLLKGLLAIDQDIIDLSNERQVKRIFCNIEQQLNNIPEGVKQGDEVKDLYGVLLKWCLGFAFTGFKLIEGAFISFLKTLMDTDLHTDCPSMLTAAFMPFLQYYNYRHSRQYEFDVSPAAPATHLTNAFVLATNPELQTLLKEDLKVTALETVEWIGLERVAEAVRISKQGKKRLGASLLAFVSAYFSEEFKRQQRAIDSASEATPKSFLLPVKVRFLVAMLKLCPSSYFPPTECLHFTREVYFEIEAVRNIKRNNWETMWEQRRGDQPRKKGEIADLASTTINLEHLSPEEQKMYLDYLWKDILEGNRHKKRIIMDHLRNYLPSSTPLLFQLLFRYLHLPERVDEDSVDSLVGKLRLMNRKNLLNGMFILKAVLIHLRQEIGYEGRFKTISVFLLSIIQIAYNTKPDEKHQRNQGEQDQDQEKQQQKQQEQNEEQENEQEQNHQQQQQGQGASDYLQYKQHRKQLQKLLQTLFANHDLQPEALSQLLQFLIVNTKINLPKSARLSVPGLLHILRIISAEKDNAVVMVGALNGEIITLLNDMIRADDHNERPLRACFEIWLQIMAGLLLTGEMIDEKESVIQAQIEEQLRFRASSTLSALLSHINAKPSRHEPAIESAKQQARRREQESLTLLRLISRLIQLQQQRPEQEWQGFIWQELSKIAKLKRNMSPLHCQKLTLLIVILSRYLKLAPSSIVTSATVPSHHNFLKKIISVLPTIRDQEQRLEILQLMIANCKELGLSQTCVELVSRMGQIKRTALIVSMDFPAFFQACTEYTRKANEFKLIDHEYFLFNLVCFADHEELSVRRAVSNSCAAFLLAVEQRIGREVSHEQTEPEDPQTGAVFLCLKIYRVFIDLLSKQSVQHNQLIYWNTLDAVELFFSWLVRHAETIEKLLPNSNIRLYPLLAASDTEGKTYFKLMGSISEAAKLKGLRLAKIVLEGVPEEYRKQVAEWIGESDTILPNPLTKLLLPVLEYLVIKPADNTEGTKSNLSSTLTKQSLELIPSLSALLSEVSTKRALKRLVSKLRFSEAQNKRNTSLIRIIGAIIDGVPGEKVNDKLHSFLEQHGFEQFHQKITQFSKAISTQTSLSDDEDSDVGAPAGKPGKRERIPDYFQRLEELESEEAINRNFLHFDRKMMELEQQGQEEAMFPAFLKKHVLLPLRTMLMKQSKGKIEQETTRSQVLLSVAVTKVLLRLPLDLFLREFQKVISRLGRLLKKREDDVRQNARTCLCEIARSVGPQLLYAIILELKFHLRDNFDRHVLNFSLYKVLDALELSVGALDYCLPLILPSVVDEIFGQSSSEKEMVEKREVKTLKSQAKRQKGLEILQVICKAISADRIAFIIDFLQKYLREHLVSEVNLGKYDHMLGAITAGLAHNPAILNPSNAPILLPILAEPICILRQQIRQLTWDDAPKHQNTTKGEWRRTKASKDAVLSLQEEAGRNKSIFKKMSKEVGERRNQEIIASSLVQFYLALLSFFLRRQVFTLASVTARPEHANHFLTLLGFLGECIDQRDNRLVTRSLKTLHIALGWKTGGLTGELQAVGDRFKSVRKQTSRKILLLVQQLTLADEELLRECFVFLNDLVSEAAVTLEQLPNFIGVIRLHTPTTEDQPHLPETYHLLRTLLFKCPQYLYHSLLDDLRLLVRLQLPNSRNKEIRDLAASILSVYLRPRQQLLPSMPQAQTHKKHSIAVSPQVQYGKRMQEELNFYLNNLECHAQDAILKLLDEFVDNREPDEVEAYGQLLVLGLMTARTNQIGREKQHPADPLIGKVLSRLNPGKAGALVQKSLLWMGQARNSSIRLCGVTFLKLILQHSQAKLNQAFLQRYVLGEGGVINRAAFILGEEVECLQACQKQEQNSKKVEGQWNDILQEMEVQEEKYQSDPAVSEILLLLAHLFKQTALPTSHPRLLAPLIVYSWQLLHSIETTIVDNSIGCLMTLQLLPALFSHNQLHNGAFQDPKNPFSARRTVSSLIFNRNSIDNIEALLRKMLEEEHRLGNGAPILIALSWLLAGLALKAHIKPTIYQQVLPSILGLLNRLSLLRDGQIDLRSIIFAEPNFQAKLLELSVKLSGNPLIPFQSKLLVEETTQILKQVMGVAEYFRGVGEYETKRRGRKQEEKARLAEMAILNPQQYIEERKGRKRV